jgi:hypothetical protein
LGLRVQGIRRHEARREIRTITTPHGQIRVKLKYVGDDLIAATPEFDDCQRLADEANLPVRVVYDAALLAAQQTCPPT